jgi:hypothetical protein
MEQHQRTVSTAAELVAAAADASVGSIVVTADLAGVPAVRLSPGQRLTAARPGLAVHFAAGTDGIQLSTGNEVAGLALVADPHRCALHNDTSVEQLGRLVLRDLQVTGLVRLLARDRVRGGHVEAHGIDIVTADARGLDERPSGFGVEVVPGVFTLWNQQADRGVTLTAELTGLSAGRAGAPVRGSGIFVGGMVGGGLVVAARLEMGPVYSDGGIAPGTADRISGGVFVVHGATVGLVRNHGPVTTYGPNDMVLDNWGSVDRWVVEDKVTSFGPSAIGFVNFGTLGSLQVNAVIETFGGGARGFNVYAGTLETASFERVVTHGDGAVGIQISQPVGEISVRRGLETWGGTGDSLVKGVVMQLPATALSVKPGGSARRIHVAGGLVTHGTGIAPFELHGRVERLDVEGGFVAAGGGFASL